MIIDTQQSKKMTCRKTRLTIMALGIMSALSCGVALAGNVSLQNQDPSSNDLVNAFLGGANQSTANTAPASQVRFRGISLKKKVPKAAPVEKTLQQEATSFDQQVTANNSASACMAGKQSVAVNINFAPNSSNVSDTTLIKNIAQAMNNDQLANCYFIIEGHTDAAGNDYYNLWLSQQRAGEVKAYLNQYNVTADRLVVVGRGEDELLNSNNPGSKENRRVVFKVINYR